MKEKIQKYIKLWEDCCYKDGLPDQVPLRLYQLNKAPSYKSVCMAILNNDHSLKSLGNTPRKSTIYSSLKRIELTNKGKIKPQINLFNEKVY